MFRLFVTTSLKVDSNITGTLAGHANVSCGVHTQVIEFETDSKADKAYDELVKVSRMSGIKREVLKLY